MEFMIDLSDCQRIVWELENQLALLREYIVELNYVAADLKTIDDMAIGIIVLKLKKRRQELEEDIRKLRLMLTALNQVIDQYRKTERKIEESRATCIARMVGEIKWPEKKMFVKAIALPRIDIVTKYFN